MNVVVVCNKLNKKTMKEYLPSKKHNNKRAEYLNYPLANGFQIILELYGMVYRSFFFLGSFFTVLFIEKQQSAFF